MKTKLFIALCTLFSVILTYVDLKAQTKESNTAISITDSKIKYEFSAEFDADKMPKVLAYMDEHLEGSGMSFKNTQAAADLTLDNKMTFYMKSSPGKLAFKFDKRKNSAEFYQQFKKMCEGIKTVIGQNK